MPSTVMTCRPCNAAVVLCLHRTLQSMLPSIDSSNTAVSGGVKPQRRSVLRHVCKTKWSMKSDKLLKSTARQVPTKVHASTKQATAIMLTADT